MTSYALPQLADLLISNILPAAALILSVVNGFILLSNYLRDVPKLVISPVHPETYQCWLQLEDTKKEDKVLRRYVFLSYFGVANRGLRDVAVNEWRLHIQNRLGLIQFYSKKKELLPYNLPEAQCIIGEHVKLIRSFGQITQNFQGDSNMIKSGDSTSGMACWMYSVWGDEGWNPKTDKYDRVKATLKIRDVFGKRTQCQLIFQRTTLENLKKMIPTIGEYLEKGQEYLI